jgi:hypothetical protein
MFVLLWWRCGRLREIGELWKGMRMRKVGSESESERVKVKELLCKLREIPNIH